MKQTELHLPQFVQYLRQRLDEQKKVDPTFSLNKFARQLSINPGILHSLLMGERKLTIETARKIGEKLGLDGAQIHSLGLDLIFESHKTLNTGDENISITLMATNTLVNFKKAGITAGWIADSLNISLLDAQQNLRILLRWGILAEPVNEVFSLSSAPHSTAWTMNQDKKNELILQARQHIEDYLHASEPPPMLSENLVFYCSPKVLEKNRARVISALANLVRELGSESEASGEPMETHYCFSQLIPCRKL
jgi:hypothetical protein